MDKSGNSFFDRFSMIHYRVSDGVCVLRLDFPPRNTITLAVLEELRECVRRANADEGVRGIVITGRRDHFSAGADIGLFDEIDSAEDAEGLSRRFHEAFQEVEDSPKPTVAAVAGFVYGGAVELAVACHYRVCSEHTFFTMPEVEFGFNPGAGATQRLPRLVGVERALEMMLTGKPLNVASARDFGLVDAICIPYRLVAAAADLLKTHQQPRRTSEQTDKIQDTAANEAALARAEQMVAADRPEILAPRKIIEAVGTGLEQSFEAGLRAEREAFAECMASPAAQNKVYLFLAKRRAGKVPEIPHVKPSSISRAGVVGMGSMGTGIVQALLNPFLPVTVFDKDPNVVTKGLARIRHSLEKRAAAGKLTADSLERMLATLQTAASWQDLSGADLVVEAVYEDAAVKRAVLRELEAVCPAETILATNTSTISLDTLAAGMERPENLIGMHFFNPAHRMPLVEVIRHDGTSPAAISTVMDLAPRIGKTPVLVRNRVGFLVNRVFLPYIKEAFRLLEEGADARAIDTAMVEFGLPMGPLALIDMAGLDILVSTDRVMSRAFPRHGPLSPIAARLVEAGRLGQKTGAGVYEYQEGDYTPHQSDPAEEITGRVREEKGLCPREIGRDEIVDRLVLRMVAEAFYALEEGIAQRESDLDVATVLGIGFPDFRGGVVRYARHLGLGQVLRRLEELTQRCGERFAPSNLLRQMSQQGDP